MFDHVYTIKHVIEIYVRLTANVQSHVDTGLETLPSLIDDGLVKV